MGFSAALRALFQGDPFGTTWPESAPVYRPTIDGRTAALRVLKRYVLELTFYRAGRAGGPPEAFQLRDEDVLTEWPDNEKPLNLPSLVVLPGTASFNSTGLVSWLDESTRDKFARGTVLQVQNEYVENIQLQVVASSRAERRCILAGLQNALVPTEQFYGLRLRMPDYFLEPACFALGTAQIIDSEESGRNRRLANLGVEMSFNQVALVRYSVLRPQILLEEVGVNIELQTPFGHFR